jgi:hypothetical protein
MSAISELNRAALFGKLNVTSVKELATSGVHHRLAPAGTRAPYVIFQRIPGRRDHALANNLVGEYDEWLIKAVVDEDSSEDLSPDSLAEQILTRCEAAIAGSLTIPGHSNQLAKRMRDMPDFIEKGTDGHYRHHGFYLAVYTSV